MAIMPQQQPGNIISARVNSGHICIYLLITVYCYLPQPLMMPFNSAQTLKILCLCTLCCFFRVNLQAQYLGGNGSGITLAKASGLQTGLADTLYKGGVEDGMAVKEANTRQIGLADSLYNGGVADGFSADTSLLQAIGLTDSLYNGGAEDGIAVKEANARQIGLSDSLYNGGIGDGVSSDTILLQAIGLPDSLYNGGKEDGIAVKQADSQQIGITDSLYNGGTGQGISSILTIFRTIGITDSVYNGGNGKGDILYIATTINLGTCAGDTLIWNGSVNIAWGNPNNWDCGVVPGINSMVIIPSGRARYPSVGVNVEIRSLRLQPGASVNIANGANLKLNGQ